MDYHPASKIFPSMTKAELKELGDDIAANGLQQPVILLDGQVLDGRNRVAACELAGIEPSFIRLTADDVADPIRYVLSANLHRRHLSTSQRAVVAKAIATMRQGRPKKDASSQTHTGKEVTTKTGKFAGFSTAQAAEAMDVSERSVRTAKRLEEKGSKALNDAVAKGDVTLHAAATTLDLPKSQQLPAAKGQMPERPPVEDIGIDEIMASVATELRSFGRRITALGKEVPACAWIDATMREILSAKLQEAARVATSAVPHKPCPACKGEACKQCRETGWMPKRKYDVATNQ